LSTLESNSESESLIKELRNREQSLLKPYDMGGYDGRLLDIESAEVVLKTNRAAHHGSMTTQIDVIGDLVYTFETPSVRVKTSGVALSHASRPPKDQVLGILRRVINLRAQVVERLYMSPMSTGTS
ncbi:hypothetical protein FOZ62_030954, partial [Perkinsus olseni]